MKKHQIAGVLGGIVVLLVLVILVAGRDEDQSPPDIYEAKDTVVYTVGADKNVLLEGVTAKDQKDGDVTESLMVENVYYTSDSKGIAVVVAKDHSNNVAKKKITFEIAGGDAVVTGTVDDAAKDQNTLENQDEPKNQEPSEETSASKKLTEEEYRVLKESQEAKGLPYLKLNTHETIINLGQNFRIQNYIEDAYNASDDATNRIIVAGDVDSQKAGDYKLQVYVTDANGNKSNTEELVVTVK